MGSWLKRLFRERSSTAGQEEVMNRDANREAIPPAEQQEQPSASLSLFGMPPEDVVDTSSGKSIDGIGDPVLSRFAAALGVNHAESHDPALVRTSLEACERHLRYLPDVAALYQMSAACRERLGDSAGELEALIAGVRNASMKSPMLLTLGWRYLLKRPDDLCVLCFCLAVAARRRQWPGPHVEAVMFVREILAEVRDPRYLEVGETVIKQFEGLKSPAYLVLKEDVRRGLRQRARRSANRFRAETDLAKDALDWLAAYFNDQWDKLVRLAADGVCCDGCGSRFTLQELTGPKLEGTRAILFDCPKCKVPRVFFAATQG
jgi:hypothetical protein